LSCFDWSRSLACSVASANSTLHRARVALERRVGPRLDWSPEAAAVDRALLERYVRAWEKGDLDAIIALLHDDVTLSMPPSPGFYRLGDRAHLRSARDWAWVSSARRLANATARATWPGFVMNRACDFPRCLL